MENYEISKYLEDFKTRINELSQAIKVENIQKEVVDAEELMKSPTFYQDMQEAQKVLKRFKEVKDVLDTYQLLLSWLEELEVYFEIHKAGEDLTNDIEIVIKKLEKLLDNFEIQMLLSQPYDHCDAIIELHPGAGGTESQDWTEILFRMYRRYAERHDYGLEILDYQEGEEAGIKSVTFMVSGTNAYGYLKSERGVHRLVRISPFDANSRRHTSFCACNVIPNIEEEVNIEIRPEDIRIDTYRSSGAGGQHVNKTDSAVRITHLKTGIVVTCQTDRSQIQNREKAMNLLKAKLYQLEQEEQDNKIRAIAGQVSENTFGSQIRSYVFHPYSMIKDHRTDFEVGNVAPVMDGDIDGFINAYLKSEFNVR
ncbi:MAG TPA: peptide chain release factor 2 [Bacilli bacterium]|nr:MAG: Peptide chain release factor 2 [Tenericutes bacterium ADurb.BinA124]HNZ50500.1 peptide chain release factor 2 [Bacilli bacterium]HPX83978.1 peptide chain release factor 2 [Bacilli bacterium]HQC74686.1 peptide chain release factor 2 [Bacilli bacterium]